uniref:Uncharacterized protein n=1 Tax=Vespula pensylvanica TaxID=30213 RepID=A0A834N9Y7_VESPE|nr:hypothetical protein H0235_015561 [Vespula pensylvanica]
MVNYSYYYVKTIGDDSENPKRYKFLKGNTKLQETPKDVWSTIGRYELRSRLLRGGLSGSGDVYHPANVTFKVRHQRFSLVSNPLCCDKIKLKVMYNNYGKSSFNYGWKAEVMEPELIRQQVKENEQAYTVAATLTPPLFHSPTPLPRKFVELGRIQVSGIDRLVSRP